VSGLVLSLFPGIGLLDMAFEEQGFCVVRGPDLLWGGDIKKFHPPTAKFDGVIGGPPCQAHSELVPLIKARGGKVAECLIGEFERVVDEAQPAWFVMENVRRAPVPRVTGYQVDPTLLNNRWLGQIQSRLHRFAFGTRDGRRLRYETVALECAEWEARVLGGRGGDSPRFRKEQRAKGKGGAIRKRPSLARALELQGLPPDFFAQSPFTKDGKHKALANAVPLFMGRALARAVVRALCTPALQAAE